MEAADGPIAYTLAGRRLYVEAEMGQSVDCELCVSAIDARGREHFTCIRVVQPGIETICRKCVPREGRFRLDVLAADPQLAAWRRLIPAGPEEPREPDAVLVLSRPGK